MKETINNEEGMALLLDCLSSLSKTDRVELIEFLLGKKIPKTICRRTTVYENRRGIMRLKQTDKIEKFLKLAFGINGECNYVKDVSKLRMDESVTFVLTDTNMGKFFVTISK